MSGSAQYYPVNAGRDVMMTWRPVAWLGIDAVSTGSTARYDDNPDGRYIEGSVDLTAQTGAASTGDGEDLCRGVDPDVSQASEQPFGDGVLAS